MARFLARRLVLMLLTVIAISVISFFIIILPPGDFVDRLVQEANQYGENLEPHEIEDLRRNYGLDRSAVEQYFVWVRNIVLRGDFGYSFGWDLPVSELIGQRLGLTALLSVVTLLFIWIVAIPIGIYSAVRKYSLGDYVFTFHGFHRPGHSEFPACTGAALHFVPLFRTERRRPVFT